VDRAGQARRDRRIRAATLAGWAAAAGLLYHAGISYIGRDNEKIEPAYAEPPVSPLRSGSPPSKAPFSELGREGRRYVTDVVTPDLIEKTLGGPAVAEPIRAYVGFSTQPLYSGGRAELALDELERMGAFDRSYLLLVSPAGSGWVDQTMISSAELLTRGDIASCAIQYGRFPSFRCWRQVPAGRQQFRALLCRVTARLASLPAERRPQVLVSGASLGAWASSGTRMRDGAAGTAVDAMNAMRTVPGVFKSFGHDYRGDTARFVHTAFGLPPVAEEQMQAAEQVLRKLELDRGRRIEAAGNGEGSITVT
jgi:uncharacterized membrane protein